MTTVFSVASLTIELDSEYDPDARPDDYGDGSAYDDAETMAAWKAGYWEFRTVDARILWNGVEIGSDSLGAVNHGTFIYTDENGNVQTVEANALAITAADYGLTDDGQPLIIGGSPANDVIMAAIGYAQSWAASVAAMPDGPLMSALDAAVKWADPNAHKRVS
jgi:hypothetical protein